MASQTSTAQMTETCRSEIVRVLGAGGAHVFVLKGDDLRLSGDTESGAAPDAAVAERARRAVDETLAPNAELRSGDASATVGSTR